MYEEMMQASLMYIEDNITEEISLEYIAGVFYTSPYHFSRIFSFMIGEPFKQYFMKRKMSHSLKMLRDGASVINTALTYGFEYPESFTRAFKQVFGTTPKQYQKAPTELKPYGIGQIITRDIVNFKGEILVKSEYVYLEGCILYGESEIVDVTADQWLGLMETKEEQFLRKTATITELDHDHHYIMAQCMGDGKRYRFKFAKETKAGEKPLDLEAVELSDGWFAKFCYKGNMMDIYTSFNADIQKWIEKKVESLEIVKGGLMVKYQEGNHDSFEVFVRLERKFW